MGVFGLFNDYATRKLTVPSQSTTYFSPIENTLPGWVNSCRLELEINYSASTSSLSP